MNRRLLPPSDPRYATCTVYGRTYTGTAGTPVTVPDSDGAALEANGWALVALSGPTGSRPRANDVTQQYQAVPGLKFFDETLNALIVFDGDVWRDPATGDVV